MNIVFSLAVFATLLSVASSSNGEEPSHHRDELLVGVWYSDHTEAPDVLVAAIVRSMAKMEVSAIEIAKMKVSLTLGMQALAGDLLGSIEQETIRFSADGRYTSNQGVAGTWRTMSDTIFMNYEGDDFEMWMKYFIEGNTFTIILPFTIILDELHEAFFDQLYEALVADGVFADSDSVSRSDFLGSVLGDLNAETYRLFYKRTDPKIVDDGLPTVAEVRAKCGRKYPDDLFIRNWCEESELRALREMKQRR